MYIYLYTFSVRKNNHKQHLKCFDINIAKS